MDRIGNLIDRLAVPEAVPKIVWGKTTTVTQRSHEATMEVYSIATGPEVATGKYRTGLEVGALPGGGLVVPVGQYALAYQTGGKWRVQILEDWSYLEGTFYGPVPILPGYAWTVFPLNDGVAMPAIQVVNPFAGTYLANDYRAGQPHYCQIHWSAAKQRWHFVNVECRYSINNTV